MIGRDSSDTIRVAFVCVQNAGRGQMAAAFAERERNWRGVTDRIEVATGGTNPVDCVHMDVVSVMRERGFDLAGHMPREIATESIHDSSVVITMGCSDADICPVSWPGDACDWDLDVPHKKPLALSVPFGTRSSIEFATSSANVP